MTAEILIADADPVLRAYYLAVAIRRGFDVRLAESGLECWELIQLQMPDVLVIDANILWGGSDGVLHRLRQSQARDRIPEIFMTGTDSAKSLSKRFGMPHQRCFQKPVEINALFGLIQIIVAAARNGELLRFST